MKQMNAKKENFSE